ncbi:MAG TPA: hypothetical protein VG754_13505 [Verrucomicrobiae bacterium]|nr:hypothetical protein [Verrucomicrobiae bacterium]
MNIIDKIVAQKKVEIARLPQRNVSVSDLNAFQTPGTYNPNGVAAQSPRLRGTRYLGNDNGKINNLEEVVSLDQKHGHNLFEVEHIVSPLPRVGSCEPTPGFETKPLRGFPIKRAKLLFCLDEFEISNPLFSGFPAFLI